MASHLSAHRVASSSTSWRVWEQFCLSLGILPFLQGVPGDRIPILLLFAHRYRTGRLAPGGKPVRSRTVEDALRHVAQAFSRLGSPDPRLNAFGDIDFRITALLQAWKRTDPAPSRVKPLPLVVLRQAVQLAHAPHSALALQACADCLIFAFYFLLRPGEYSGTPSAGTDDLFRLQDVGLWVGHRRLDPLTCRDPELLAATFATLTFTNQKNGVRGETLGHGRSGHPFLCPVLSILRRLLHLRAAGATPATPLNAYSSGAGCWTYVLPAAITSLLRTSVTLLGPAALGFATADISARATRAGGAMAMLCGGVDSDRIRLIGRWRSDEMYRYLHVQAQPVMAGVAPAMLRGGDFRLNSSPTLLVPPLPGGQPPP